MKKQNQTIELASPRSSGKSVKRHEAENLIQDEGGSNITPAQPRLSTKPADADKADIFSFPRILVVYDDVPAGQRAIRVLTNVFNGSEHRLQLLPRFWRFDFLEDSDGFVLARADAANADIIVITTSATHGLETSVEDWIKSCLPRKCGGSAAVVALLGPEEDMDGKDSPRFQFLQDVVQKAGLDFFAPQIRHQRPFPGHRQSLT